MELLQLSIDDHKSDISRKAILSNENYYLKRLAWFTRPPNFRFTSIGLFSGGGGLDLGLSFAGFKAQVVSDVNSAFVSTIEYNLPHVKSYVKDAMDLSGSELLKFADGKSIDLMNAGPPCQSFSILGRRQALADPRGKLTYKYIELIAQICPRAFIFENVPGILTVNKGQDWNDLLFYITNATNYKLHYAKLNAADFGIPQYRERVIIVGFRKDVDCSKFEFPSKPSGAYAEHLLNHIPSSLALEGVDDLPNQLIRVHGDRVRNRYEKIPQGGRDRTDHTDRIDSKKPSGTVLVGSSAGGGRPHIHPDEPRVITVREAARLQSFPDWYVFQGSTTDQYRQVGNAVPPLLAYEIGVAIAKVLSGGDD